MTRSNVTRRRHALAALVLLAGAFHCTPSPGETVTLKCGMTFEGSLAPIASIGGDPFKAASDLERIVIIDNQLTRTFVGKSQIIKIDTPAATSPERIKVDQKVATAGRPIHSVGPILRNDPFDEWGRRIFSMASLQGNVDLVQGITEITPKWTKLEAIQGENSYVLTVRIATNSIPRDQLSRILFHVIDPKNSDQRLRVVRLYLQAERFQDARAELEQLLKDFPELAHLKDQVKTLHQLSAQRLLTEIDLRLDAGQYRLGIAMLEQFPAEGVPGETLLKVREMLDEIAGYKAAGAKALALLSEHLAALAEENDRTNTRAIVEEIKRDLSVNTLDRMADYLRLADDKSLTAEQKLSLAISGWLMGSGSGVESLAVSKSLFQIRDVVRQYLAATRKPDRDQLLAQLTSLEGATPRNVSKLIANMRPPLAAAPVVVPKEAEKPAPALGKLPGEDTKPVAARPVAPKEPAPAEPEDSCAPKGDKKDDGALLEGGPKLPTPSELRKQVEPAPPTKDAPAAPAAPTTPAAATLPENENGPKATDIPGLFELTAAGLPEDPQIKYWVQLPPDYDSYRRYPCVITLNGAGTTLQKQIDWWAGAYSPKAQTRYGQATRHGYIVIAPRWASEHQRKYEYTAREHAAVLRTLTHACKRYSIDTDKVFLSGHSMGGDAAWDIGLAHPDLWAGVLPIVAVADKYVKRYWENAKYVPFYFVFGEKDGNKLAANFADWDRYLAHNGFEAVVVQYQGRGHEDYQEEILNLFAWMNLHTRNFFPKEFTVYSLRPWDSFFWWVETDQSKPLDANIILPAEWGKRATPAKTEAKVLPTNGVMVSAGTAKATVFLSPDMVNFENRVNVRINGKTFAGIQPSVATILEDVRTRGDRQHPFWAKVEN